MTSDYRDLELYEKSKQWCKDISDKSQDIQYEDDKYGLIEMSIDNTQKIVLDITKDNVYFIMEIGTFSKKDIPYKYYDMVIESGKKGFLIYQRSLFVSLPLVNVNVGFDDALEELKSIYQQRENILNVIEIDDLRKSVNKLNKDYLSI